MRQGRSFHAVALGALLLASPVTAATFTTELTVPAGKQERRQTPVCVPLSLPDGLEQAGCQLMTADGKPLPCQLTGPGLRTEALKGDRSYNRELHFILPELAAGATLRLKLTVDSSFPTTRSAFSWHEDGSRAIELRQGSRPVLRYMCEPLDDSTPQRRVETYKVFHHLFDPEGSDLVTKGAGGAYTHHRGLFYGFSRVSYGQGKNVDIWHCRGDTFQAHEAVVSQETGPVLARQRLEIGWHGQGKEAFACEVREITVYNVPGGTLLDFVSELRPEEGKVTVDGDPQHAGFHFRAANEVARETARQTIYVRPDGVGKPGETRNWPGHKDHVNLPWNAMSFVLGQQRYSVAYLDHPANPKEARYSERDYGRFGSYFVAEATEEKPLRVAYRVWLQRGQIAGTEAARLSQDFVSPIPVEQGRAGSR